MCVCVLVWRGEGERRREEGRGGKKRREERGGKKRWRVGEGDGRWRGKKERLKTKRVKEREEGLILQFLMWREKQENKSCLCLSASFQSAVCNYCTDCKRSKTGNEVIWYPDYVQQAGETGDEIRLCTHHNDSTICSDHWNSSYTQGAMSRKRETSEMFVIRDLCKIMPLRTVLQCCDTKGYGLLTALTC